MGNVPYRIKQLNTCSPVMNHWQMNTAHGIPARTWNDHRETLILIGSVFEHNKKNFSTKKVYPFRKLISIVSVIEAIK